MKRMYTSDIMESHSDKQVISNKSLRVIIGQIGFFFCPNLGYVNGTIENFIRLCPMSDPKMNHCAITHQAIGWARSISPNCVPMPQWVNCEPQWVNCVSFMSSSEKLTVWYWEYVYHVYVSWQENDYDVCSWIQFKQGPKIHDMACTPEQHYDP